jgi:hypothetical protein
MDLHQSLLKEILRLGTRVLHPQQLRWPYCPHTRQISFRPDHWKDSEISELLWLEDELSSYLLDSYERCRPGALERRAMRLIMRATNSVNPAKYRIVQANSLMFPMVEKGTG